jgi:hypothetical protein
MHCSDDPGSTELTRVYKFEFLPNGFFSRLMVRLLHSQWQASLFWKHGIVLFKDMARLYLRYAPDSKEMTIQVRGPDNGNKMGSLIESINTLIKDWLKDVKIDVFVPTKLPDGRLHQFDIKDIEKAIGNGQTNISGGGQTVAIATITPDLAMAGAVSGGNLSESELDISKELGRGGFAIVYKVRSHPV